ncbi:MAG: hypothetical protein OEM82_05960 [Acidobacteriota bacterium]|nr:hypothetical protein [Acidobacteriota bacterium]MDH3528490.1 hypothetical protein [Acidobacteriota bacterium]
MKKTILLAAFVNFVLIVPNAFGTPSIANAGPEARKITISGSLKRTVEPGGWLIVSGKKKFLILNAGRFARKSWFVAGAKVEASGSLRNQPTFFMEGQPFQVDKLTPRCTQSNLNTPAAVTSDS